MQGSLIVSVAVGASSSLQALSKDAAFVAAASRALASSFSIQEDKVEVRQVSVSATRRLLQEALSNSSNENDGNVITFLSNYTTSTTTTAATTSTLTATTTSGALSEEGKLKIDYTLSVTAVQAKAINENLSSEEGKAAFGTQFLGSLKAEVAKAGIQMIIQAVDIENAPAAPNTLNASNVPQNATGNYTPKPRAQGINPWEVEAILHPEDESSSRAGVIAAIIILLLLAAAGAIYAAFHAHPGKPLPMPRALESLIRRVPFPRRSPQQTETGRENRPAQAEAADPTKAQGQPSASGQVGSQTSPGQSLVNVPDVPEEKALTPQGNTATPAISAPLPPPSPAALHLGDVTMQEAQDPNIREQRSASQEFQEYSQNDPAFAQQGAGSSFESPGEGLPHTATQASSSSLGANPTVVWPNTVAQEVDVAAGTPKIDATPSTGFNGSPGDELLRHDSGELQSGRSANVEPESDRPIKEVRPRFGSCTCLTMQLPGGGAAQEVPNWRESKTSTL